MLPNTYNFLRGPSALEFDAGVAKSFAVYKEAVRLRFRADAFNVLNHPIFANPAADLTSASTFGQITASSGTQPNRVLQLALRLEF